MYNLKYKYFILIRFILYSYDEHFMPTIGMSSARNHFLNDGNKLIGNSYSDYDSEIFSDETFKYIDRLLYDSNFMDIFINPLFCKE